MKIKNCLPCTEIRYREFPDMLFGMSDDNQTYFDALRFISKYGDVKKHNIREFDIGFFHWKRAVSSSYNVSFDDLIIKDSNTGGVLVHEALDLLFISYIDPEYGVYMIEKQSEMMINGIAFSDNFLLAMATSRFSSDDLIRIIKQNEEKHV